MEPNLFSSRKDYSIVEEETTKTNKSSGFNTLTQKGRAYKIPSGLMNNNLMTQLNRGGKKSSKQRKKNKEASKQRKKKK